MPHIMTTEAREIARKLDRDVPVQPGRQPFRVEFRHGRNHATIVKIWYGDHWIGQYGFHRHTREQRRNYIAGQLYLSVRDAYDLAKCPLTVDDYITILEDKGEIPRTSA